MYNYDWVSAVMRLDSEGSYLAGDRRSERDAANGSDLANHQMAKVCDRLHISRKQSNKNRAVNPELQKILTVSRSCLIGDIDISDAK